MPDINMQVFEEAKRNQLVTEVDIQTQVALEDYQVKLSDIANPTQSQDNVIIDRYGEFLPHWNESLDFDTWVKMSMELAGKKLLVIHGDDGLSNESSIDDTFIDGSEFNDLTSWTQQAGTWTVASGIMSSPNAGGNNYLRRTAELPISDNYIIEQRFRGSSTYYYGRHISESDNPIDYTVGYQFFANQSNNDMRMYIDSVLVGNPSVTVSASTWYKSKTVINEAGNHEMYLYNDAGTLLQSKTDITTDTTNTDSFWGYFAAGTDDLYDVDYVFIRKRTDTEPIHSIYTPKNILTTLKSLGRAG